MIATPSGATSTTESTAVGPRLDAWFPPLALRLEPAHAERCGRHPHHRMEAPKPTTEPSAEYTARPHEFDGGADVWRRAAQLALLRGRLGHSRRMTLERRLRRLRHRLRRAPPRRGTAAGSTTGCQIGDRARLLAVLPADVREAWKPVERSVLAVAGGSHAARDLARRREDARPFTDLKGGIDGAVVVGRATIHF